MVQVSPTALAQPQTRESGNRFMGMVRAMVEKIIDGRIFRVKVEGEAFDPVVRELQKLNSREAARVAKGSFSVEKVAGFNITNLENLDLKNIENVNFSLKQLDVIVRALEKSNTFDSQSAVFLREIRTLMTQLRDKEMPRFEMPKVQQVSGSVSIADMPSSPELRELVNKVETLASALMKQTPAPSETFKDKGIISAVQDLKKSLETLPSKMQKMDFPTSISVNNFPPTKYPIPPTNININPLRGYVKTTAITLNATTPTGLPNQTLTNRRAVMIYNNSASTIYIGGTDVTAVSGLPVPAGSYSPSLDAGPRMIVCGITATGTANVRVLEVSNDAVGSA